MLRVDFIRFLVSFILLFYAFRAYLRTKHISMLYLTIGFSFLTFGHLLTDIYFYYNADLHKLYSEIFDIMGLISLIIAIKKIN